MRDLTENDLILIAQVQARLAGNAKRQQLGIPLIQRASYERAGVPAYVLDAINWSI